VLALSDGGAARFVARRITTFRPLEHPVAAVWVQPALNLVTFNESGEVTDRGLRDGLSRSGWTSEEVRAGPFKPYKRLMWSA